MTKYERAAERADAGETNASIHATLSQEFGSGISSRVLAEIRSTKAERDKEKARQAREELRVAKRELVRELLAEGKSGYACQQACKAEFGSGVGHDVILSVQQELAEVDKADIEPVELPPDLYDASNVHEGDPEHNPDDPDDLLEEANSLAVVPPHVPNGTLKNMKAIQAWMKSIDAEELTLTRDGRLSVLARHEFNLGGIE